MKKKDAIAFFRTPRGVARAAGVSDAAVSQWGDRIPLGTAALLEKASGGKLKLNPADYRQMPAPETDAAPEQQAAP